jgi:hypothetical protein
MHGGDARCGYLDGRKIQVAGLVFERLGGPCPRIASRALI